MITYILVASCFVIGILLQTFGKFRDRLTAGLNNFAIYVALPAIVLVKVPLLHFTLDALFVVLSAWSAMAISTAVFIPLSRRMNWPREVTIVVVVLSGLGNTAFLGMALIKLLFDDSVLGFAVLYDQLGSFLVLSFACPLVLVLKGNSGERPSLLAIGKNVLTFPPFISLVVALTLPIAPVTEVLQAPLEWLGLSLLPLAILIVGLQFQLRVAPEYRFPIAASLMVKMFLVPVLVTLMGLSFGIPNQMFLAAVVQSAMPPMVTPAIFLISLNLAPRLTASILSLGTLISFVTIPAIAFLLN